MSLKVSAIQPVSKMLNALVCVSLVVTTVPPVYADPGAATAPQKTAATLPAAPDAGKPTVAIVNELAWNDPDTTESALRIPLQAATPSPVQPPVTRDNKPDNGRTLLAREPAPTP